MSDIKLVMVEGGTVTYDFRHSRDYMTFKPGVVYRLPSEDVSLLSSYAVKKGCKVVHYVTESVVKEPVKKTVVKKVAQKQTLSNVKITKQ